MAPGLDLAVHGGQVACPRRGRTDIESCFECGDFEGLQDAPVERLICAASHDPDLLLSPVGSQAR